MLVFIDESGDSWFKFDKWSSDFFTISLVVFNDYDEALNLDKAIDVFRNSLNKGKFEFHFAQNSDKIKEWFIKTIFPFNFFYYWFVLNKKKIYWDWFRDKKSFYKVITWYLFENAKDKLINAKIIIDKHWNNEFRTELAKYLKKKMNDEAFTRIKEVKMEESHRNNLLQVADYIASWLNRKFANNRKNNDFIKVLNIKEIDVQFWPKD